MSNDGSIGSLHSGGGQPLGHNILSACPFRMPCLLFIFIFITRVLRHKTNILRVYAEIRHGIDVNIIQCALVDRNRLFESGAPPFRAADLSAFVIGV